MGALSLRATDGDPGWLLMWLICVVMASLTAAVVVLYLRRRSGMRQFASRARAIADLERQLASMHDILAKTWAAAGRTPPEGFTTTCPDPAKLRMIVGDG